MKGRIFSIAAIAILSHINSLPGAFHYDDAHTIVENLAIRNAGNIPYFFGDPGLFSSEPGMAMYRPLVSISYALNYAVGGLSPFTYLLFNLFLHAAVAIVVLLFLEQWLPRPYAAWWAAAIFAIHPVNAQIVNYISSRSEGLATLGVVAALYYMGSRQRAWAWGSYGLALMSKSQAVVLLPLLFVGQWREGKWRQRMGELGPFIGLTAVYLCIIYGNGFLPRSLAQDVRGLDMQYFTQVKALVYYLQLFILPHNLSIEHAFIEGTQLLSGPVICSLLFLTSVLYLALRSANWAARGALFWLGAMSLTSIVPLNVLVNEHRLYIGSIGLSAGLLSCITLMPRRPLYWAGITYLALMSVLTWQRNEVWRDEYSLWQDAAKRAPNMFRVQSNLGLALLDKGLPEDAKEILTQAVQTNPNYARTWNNLGLAYEELGAYALADSAYRRAVDLNSDHAGFRANMGRLYLGQGRYGEAIGVLDVALSLDPSSLEARVNIGLAHQRAGRVEEAVEHYEYALQIGGLSAEGYNNLGLAYQDLGRLDDAERAFSDALAQTPDDLSIQINMRTLALRRGGLAGLELYEVLVGEFPNHSALWRMAAAEYARLGQLGQAIIACEKILQLEPNDARARRNLDLLRKRFSPGAD